MVGFEDTVVPEVERALIAGHDLVLLGERGQGKTRLIRTLVGLLDEWTPVLVGSSSTSTRCTRSRLGHPADRRARRRHPGRLAAPQRPVRREAGDTGHQRRRPDRRRRPDQGRRGPDAGRPRDRPLRPGPAHQPRHLQRQRAARPRRAHPGRAAERAGGAGHPDPRLPGAAAPGPAARRQRQPRGLHQPRADHHPAQGPLRRRGAHALPAGAPDEIRLLHQEAKVSWRGPAGGNGTLDAPIVPEHLAEIIARFTRLVRDSGHVDQRSGVSARFAIAGLETLRLRRPPRRHRRGDPSGRPRRRPPSVVPASRGKVEFADSGADPDDDRGGDPRAPAAPGHRPDLPRPLRRPGPHRPAGALHRRGDGRIRRAGPAAALLGQLGSIPKLAELLTSGRARGRAVGRAGGRRGRVRLEGLYLTRRLAKDVDGVRTVYGA